MKTPTNPPSPPSQPLPWMLAAAQGIIDTQRLLGKPSAEWLAEVISQHDPSPVAAHGGLVEQDLKDAIDEAFTTSTNRHADCLNGKEIDAIMNAVRPFITAPPLQPAQDIPCQTAEESRVGAASGDTADVVGRLVEIDSWFRIRFAECGFNKTITDAIAHLRRLEGERDAALSRDRYTQEAWDEGERQRDALRKEVAARSDNESALAMQLRESRSEVERLKVLAEERWQQIVKDVEANSKDLADTRRFQGNLIRLTHENNDLRAQLATLREDMRSSQASLAANNPAIKS